MNRRKMIFLLGLVSLSLVCSVSFAAEFTVANGSYQSLPHSIKDFTPVLFDEFEGWPVSRKGAAMVEWSGNLLLFGGKGETQFYDTPWLLTDSWNDYSSMVGTTPVGRYRHSLASDENGIYAFGGEGESGYLNDLWYCHPICSMLADGTGTAPSPRVRAAMLYVNGEVYLYGGGKYVTTESGDEHWEIYSDLWKFSDDSWTLIATDTSMPSLGGYMFYMDNKIYVVGGFVNNDLDPNSSMLVFDTTTGEWQVSSISEEIPGGGGVANYNGVVYVVVPRGSRTDLFIFEYGQWSKESIFNGVHFTNTEAAFAQLGAFIYAFGGLDSATGNVTNVLYKFGLLSHRWSFVGPCGAADDCSVNASIGSCVTPLACVSSTHFCSIALDDNYCLYQDSLCVSVGNSPATNSCIYCNDSQEMVPTNEGVLCGDSFCFDNKAFDAPKCVSGECVFDTTSYVDCTPYLCYDSGTSAGCVNSCVVDSDCAPGFVCDGDTCVERPVDGDEDSEAVEADSEGMEIDGDLDEVAESDSEIESEPEIDVDADAEPETDSEVVVDGDVVDEDEEGSNEQPEMDETAGEVEAETDVVAEAEVEEGTDVIESSDPEPEQEYADEDVVAETETDTVVDVEPELEEHGDAVELEESAAEVADTDTAIEQQDVVESESVENTEESDAVVAETEQEETPRQQGSTGEESTKSLYSCSQNGASSLFGLLVLLGVWLLVLRRRHIGLKGAAVGILFGVLLLGIGGFAHAAEIKDPSKTKIAILPMNAKYGIPQGVADLVTGQIIGQLAEKKFVVTPMADVQKILEAEAKKQQLGCEDGSCYTELGNALGVDYLMTGEMGKLGDMYLFSLRLISVRDGKTSAWSEYLQSGSESAFINLLPAALYTLFPRVFPPPVEKLDEMEAVKTGKQTPKERQAQTDEDALTDGLSHDGLFLIDAFGQADYKFRGLAGGLSLGYGFVKYFEAHISTIFAPHQVGLRVGWRAFFYNYNGHVKPFGGLMITTFFLDTIPVGIGGDLGVMFDVNTWLGFYLSVPMEYYFSIPDDVEPFNLTYMFGAQIRI